MRVNKILISRDRPEQFPSFFACSFQWNQAAFPKLIIFLKYQRIVWLACYFTVFMILKMHFKIFRKRSHRICSNFAIMEATMAGTYSLKRFLQKSPGTEKHEDK